ncbi:hypothetical protein Sme01_64610 [Sphaerisporangium melleum]|uniref:STAS domain-containing protein n=1 Tax=Sphaerisporangium melleum TaxID=321316 RepID=A0A917RF77_9ACTN|nr:MEDS domain-containing protein [Sphaerisporangium melleum]GGL04052.1 hypothetical protein GCM10007964_52700 [Sphaerisporangium melleum]GII73985.1 hypothetical protein Sme01_64610 [Sphaerisporangium melleum]
MCWAFDDDGQRLAALGEYVNAGVRADQKIIYFSDTPPDILLGELQNSGVDARRLADSGRLQFGLLPIGRLHQRMFDPVAVIDAWRQEIDAARSDGFSSLRVIGDMAWASGPTAGADRVQWYEAQVNRVFTSGHVMALCLYDRRLFDSGRLVRIAAAHPASIDPTTNWAWRPLLRMERTGRPPGLRLIGEADASNREALAATLAEVTGDLSGAGTQMTLDVAGLRFADAAAARLLMTAAGSTSSDVRITGCSVSLGKLMRLVGGEPYAGAPA